MYEAIFYSKLKLTKEFVAELNRHDDLGHTFKINSSGDLEVFNEDVLLGIYDSSTGDFYGNKASYAEGKKEARRTQKKTSSKKTDSTK
jgi:hypothetical protein